MTGGDSFLTILTVRLTAASFLGNYLSRIFSASSFEIEFEGTLTSTPSRRTSSIRRLVSIFRSLARSYMRTLEVTADMRSLLLAKVVAFAHLSQEHSESALLPQVSEATRASPCTRATVDWPHHRKHLIASRPSSSRPQRPFRRVTIRERNLFHRQTLPRPPGTRQHLLPGRRLPEEPLPRK